jgi:hypothetical protein
LDLFLFVYGILTPIIDYTGHFVAHQAHQIYSLGLMGAKAVVSKSRSETELDEGKMINSIIAQQGQYPNLGSNYFGITP